MNTVVEAILAILILTGCSFILLGSVALLRLRDFFQRLHGPGMASSLGIGCVLLVSIAYHALNGSGVHPRELLITVFLFLTGPISAHLMSRAALSLMGEPPPHPGRTPEPAGPSEDPQAPAPPESHQTQRAQSRGGLK